MRPGRLPIEDPREQEARDALRGEADQAQDVAKPAATYRGEGTKPDDAE